VAAPPAAPTSSGVQELIDRLRDEGVEVGRREAGRIVEEARREAGRIVAEARAEAEALRTRQREETEAERAAAREALTLAARDTVLDLKAEMTSRFASQVRRLVAAELRDPEFLRRLILEVAGRAVPERGEDERTELLLPTEAVGVDDLRARPEEVREGTLTHLVLALSHDMLCEGLELGVREDGGGGAGLRVRLADRDLEIDLTERAVAELLLRHLLPRFRALLEGIVR
jgi:V/A-type H+-transporting ATPase subunit E